MPEYTDHTGAAPSSGGQLISMPSTAGFNGIDAFRCMQNEQTANRMARQILSDPDMLAWTQFRSGTAVTDLESAVRLCRPMAQDAQTEFDNVIVEVGLERLAVFAELMRRGLTSPLRNWLAKKTVQWDVVGESGTAIETMDLRTDFPSARRERSPDSIPVPALMEGARFGIRELVQSQLSGDPLDLDRVREASRNVNLAVEDKCVNGGGVVVGGTQAFGFMNHPASVNVPYTGGLAWTNPSHLPQHKIDDVRNLIGELRNRNRNGPYVLALNAPYEHEISAKINPTQPTEGTIRTGLEELVNNGQPLTIVSTDALATDRIFLFEPSRSVVDVLEGQQPTSVSWSVDPGWETWVAVVACLITRIKTDANGFVGIATGDLT